MTEAPGTELTAVAGAAADADAGYPGLKRWPLSYAQELLWFLGRRWPKADLAHRLTVSSIETFTEPVDLTALHAALADIVDRHETLRSAIVVDDEGQPWLVVCPPSAPVVVRHDLRHLPRDEAQRRADEILAELVAAPVSVHRAPAIRFVLVTIADDLHRLGVCAHHMFFDYWSARLFKKEFWEVYRAAHAGHRSPLHAAEIQYVDYTSWEREVLDTPAHQAGLDYWVRELADLPPLRLPTDRPRPWFVTGTARRATVVFPAELNNRIKEYAQSRRASPFMVLVGVFLCLLAHETGHHDVAIPTIFSGRTQPETRKLMGYFDNLLILRYRCDDSLTVAEMLDQVREVVLTAYQYHETPMLRVIERQPRLMLMLSNAVNIWTLFHLEVDPHRLRADGEPGEGAETADAPDRLDDVSVEFGDEKSTVDDEQTYSFGADLDVTLRETPGTLYLRTLYNADLFEGPTVTRLLDRYVGALTAAMADPSTRVRDLFAAATGRM